MGGSMRTAGSLSLVRRWVSTSSATAVSRARPDALALLDEVAGPAVAAVGDHAHRELGVVARRLVALAEAGEDGGAALAVAAGGALRALGVFFAGVAGGDPRVAEVSVGPLLGVDGREVALVAREADEVVRRVELDLRVVVRVEDRGLATAGGLLAEAGVGRAGVGIPPIARVEAEEELLGAPPAVLDLRVAHHLVAGREERPREDVVGREDVGALELGGDPARAGRVGHAVVRVDLAVAVAGGVLGLALDGAEVPAHAREVEGDRLIGAEHHRVARAIVGAQDEHVIELRREGPVDGLDVRGAQLVELHPLAVDAAGAQALLRDAPVIDREEIADARDPGVRRAR